MLPVYYLLNIICQVEHFLISFKFYINMTKPNPLKDISGAASDAVKVIANAAKQAKKVITDAAATANTKTGNDHDLLVILNTKMEGLKVDIQDLKDGTSTKINDHEVRLNALETNNTKITVMLGIGIGILTLLVSLLVWHLVGK